MGLGFCFDFNIVIFGFEILRNGFGCLRKEKKKNCLGTSDGERKKRKERRKRTKEEDGL